MFFVVQRAGFEPANPYGKGYLLAILALRDIILAFLFDYNLSE
jgi:hypothetical protein